MVVSSIIQQYDYLFSPSSMTKKMLQEILERDGIKFLFKLGYKSSICYIDRPK